MTADIGALTATILVDATELEDAIEKMREIQQLCDKIKVQVLIITLWSFAFGVVIGAVLMLAVLRG